MKNKIVYAVAALLLFSSSVPLGLAQAETVPIIISAVQITGGTGKTNYDFVELYNPNSQAVSLQDYKLVKRTASGQTDSLLFAWDLPEQSIPAKSFYLWANNGYSEIGLSPDVVSAGTIANDNGVALRLGELDTGEIISSLAWGSASNGFANAGSVNPTAFKSLAWIDLGSLEPEYEIRDSQPRNSTITWQGDGTVEESPLTDDASCASHSIPAQITVGESLQASLAMLNIGQTVWLSGDSGYSLAVNAQQWSLFVTADVSAGQQAEFTFISDNFAEPGEYLFTWQMQNNSALTFGAVCSVSVTVLPAVEEPDLPDDTLVKITEIFPNPTGADSGTEAVEFYNSNDLPINLKGWYLDDIDNGQSLSSNAYNFLTDFIVPAKGYRSLILPAGSFALNNSGGEFASLLNSAKQFIDTVYYSVTVPENISYALIDGQWMLNSPSLGQANVKDVVDEPDNEGPGTDEPSDPDDTGDGPGNEQDSGQNPVELIITEIYAFPDVAGSVKTEFIEIYNASNFTARLQDYQIKVGDRGKFLPEEELLAGEFWVIEGKQLPLQLRNTGQTLQLVHKHGQVIDGVSYPKSDKGMSYSLNNSGEFHWTTSATPGQSNEIIAPQPKLKSVTASSNQSVARKSVAKISGQKNVNKSARAKTPNSKDVNRKSSTASQPQSEDTKSAFNSSHQPSSTAGKKTIPALILAGLTTVAGAMFALYRSGIV